VPALVRIGVKKQIGWHSFRHGLATMLRQKGVDIKTAQELLRHAHSRITQDIYQQSVREEKRLAQDLVFRGSAGRRLSSAPLGTLKDQMKANVTSINHWFHFGLWRE
jgi:hypothetical protein